MPSPETESTPKIDDPLARRTAPTEHDRFGRHLQRQGPGRLRRTRITTLQLNIGLRCNLACHHCHVESGPRRTEAIDSRGIDRILSLLAHHPQIETLDITGGAPEMHPEFKRLVRGARSLGRRVLDRCNLTIFFEPGQHDLPEFLAENRVDVVASLPCYSLENVEKQRGRGVFDRSIRALKRLNELGYGRRHTGLVLDLVYNPVGAFLPPDQSELEAEYRDQLERAFGVTFDRLLTITNMPIKRFAHELHRDGDYDRYMDLLVQSFNAETLPNLMCRHLISVSHDGSIYDCDFNQALGIAPPGPARSIFDPDILAQLEGQSIATAEHCFGCTSGAGSSCGGSLS